MNQDGLGANGALVYTYTYAAAVLKTLARSWRATWPVKTHHALKSG
jgi:hypothetical protein